MYSLFGLFQARLIIEKSIRVTLNKSNNAVLLKWLIRIKLPQEQNFWIKCIFMKIFIFPRDVSMALYLLQQIP